MSDLCTPAEAEKHAVAQPFLTALKGEPDVVEPLDDPVQQS